MHFITVHVILSYQKKKKKILISIPKWAFIYLPIFISFVSKKKFAKWFNVLNNAVWSMLQNQNSDWLIICKTSAV